MLEGLKPFYNSILRPAARFLCNTGIQPNHITLLGLALFGAAGWFCSTGEWKTALILVIFGALMDGLDGVLARNQTKKPFSVRLSVPLRQAYRNGSAYGNSVLFS